MPSYDFKCNDCGDVTTHFNIPYPIRKDPMVCRECGGIAGYQFPVNAAQGFQPFEAYHDEGLGVDIHGRRERQQVMKARGVVEAGGTVGGARNVDKFSTGGILELNGNRLHTEQYKDEAARKHRDNTIVAAINKDGSETVHRMGDISSDTRKAIHQGSKTGDKNK